MKITKYCNNHSANINYQDFMKIYRKYAREPYNVLTIDTMSPAINSFRFGKNLFDSCV